jgi:Family of unknown function (DUF6338)
MDVLDTFLVTALAALPGALFTFAYERETRIVRAAVSDRLLRLTTASTAFYVAAAPLGYWLYLRYVRTGQLATGPVPWALWLVPIGLVVLPVGLGLALGGASRRGRPWARLWSGQSPEPSAWDAAFGHGVKAWVRIRLKDPAAGTDGWLLGAFGPATRGPRSVASSYPDPPDLYLSETAEAEPETGNFVLQDGRPKLRNTGLLIRWDEISYIELSYVPGSGGEEKARG